MTWSIALILKGTLILLVAWALVALRPKLSAAVRDMIWTTAFLGLLALPFLSFFTPAWSAPENITYAVESAANAVAPVVTVDWLAWIWLAGFLVTLNWLGVAHARAAFLMARSPRISTVGEITVRRTPAGTMPMTAGILSPAIFLPEDAKTWSDEMRNAVLAHERAHIRRNDILKQFLIQFACCLWWFHPLAWAAAKHAARAREEACDNEVLSLGAAGADYADHLIQVARGRRKLAATQALPFGSQLEGRVLAVLDHRARRNQVNRKMIIATGTLAVLLLLPFAGMQLWAEKVYSIRDGAESPTLILKVEPEYTEDARDAGVEGVVVLLLEVSSKGLPENILLVDSLDPGLDERAIQAVKKWRFRPGTKDGKPVRVSATIEVNFRLD